MKAQTSVTCWISVRVFGKPKEVQSGWSEKGSKKNDENGGVSRS